MLRLLYTVHMLTKERSRTKSREGYLETNVIEEQVM